MSKEKDYKFVWAYIIFIFVYVLLHGVFEVGYLRQELKRHDKEISHIQKEIIKINMDFASHTHKLIEHTHRYYDGKINNLKLP